MARHLAYEACTHLFIDVGANVGDSLAKFFTQPSCYEHCTDEYTMPNGVPCKSARHTCGYQNGYWMGDCPTANETCFCHDQAKLGRCGWEWPYWLPLGERRKYCAEAFEPNPLLAAQLHRTAHRLVNNGASPHIRVRNGTAWSTKDGVADFGIDTNFTLGSSLVLDKRTMDRFGRPGRGAPVGDNRVKVRTVDAVNYLRTRAAQRIVLKVRGRGRPRSPSWQLPPCVHAKR